ncbi:MAG: O-antigen ligase family protein [Fuerstiella sp.]|nr:O-antigen ligase family protein [Fuerstiella sp.]
MSAGAAIHSGRRSRVPTPALNPHELLQVRLQQLCDAGIAMSIFVVPLTMAGLREYGVALFVFCSFVAGIAWASQQLLSPASNSPAAAAASIAALAIGLVWLQFQPLPDHLLSRLSPFSFRFLPLWGSAEGRILHSHGWNRISMTPEATRSGFVLLLAYTIFFLTLLQRLRIQQDVDRLIKMIGLSAVAMGIIGIAQLAIGDDRFLWMIDHPTRTASWPAKGTFTNQNHFAHFLSLGIGPLLWWWQSFDQESEQTHSRKRSRGGSSIRNRLSRPNTRFPGTESRWPRLLIGVGVAVLTIGVLYSLSRGGIVVFLMAATIAMFAAGCSWRSVLRLFVSLSVFLAFVILAFGLEQTTTRWNQVVQAGSIDELSHGRWVLWSALSQAVSEFWPSGSGVGSHADIYPIWMSEQFHLRFSHAECGYLQILVETGLPGLMLLLAGIGLCVAWCVRGWSAGTTHQRRRILALAAGLTASVLHSLVDFVWYIPGCMVLTLAILACVSRCSHLARSAKRPGMLSQTRFATLLAGTLIVCVLPVGHLFADTIHRDLSATQHWKSFHNSMREIAKDFRHDRTLTLDDRLEFLIGTLEQCILKNPFHHEAHAALAPLYLQRFEKRSKAGANQMTLQDVRDTVQQAEFQSHSEIHEWLVRAFGDDVRDLHRATQAARLALQKRPLRGECYIVLSETAFLAGASREEPEAVVDQAVRVRPHEPRVLYAAGLLENDSNNEKSAWKFWRHAAALDSGIARRIVSRFVDRMPLDRLIKRLSPDRMTYRIVYDVFRRNKRSEQQKIIATAFANDHLKLLRQDEEGTAADFRFYATMLDDAEYYRDALWCLRQAVRKQPEYLPTRRLLVRALITQGLLEDAQRELNWLRVRRPKDQQITKLVNDVESRLTTRRSSPGRTSHVRIPTPLSFETVPGTAVSHTGFASPESLRPATPAITSQFIVPRSPGDSINRQN